MSQSGDISRSAAKRCIAQYALNLFCITERRAGGHEKQGNVWDKRTMSGGFSYFLQCCALKVGQREREREKLHDSDYQRRLQHSPLLLLSATFPSPSVFVACPSSPSYSIWERKSWISPAKLRDNIQMVAGNKRDLEKTDRGSKSWRKGRGILIASGGFHHSLTALGDRKHEKMHLARDVGLGHSPSPTICRIVFAVVRHGRWGSLWGFELWVVGLSSALGVHSERSAQGFCWGAPRAQNSSSPCLKPITCSLCPGDTSRCVREIWSTWDCMCVCVLCICRCTAA